MSNKGHLSNLAPRASSTSPLKERKLAFIREETSNLLESQTTTADVTQQIYRFEAQEAKALLEDLSERKRFSDILKKRTSRKDKHIRKLKDFEASYSRPKQRLTRSSANKSSLTSNMRSLSTERFISKAMMAKVDSFSISPTKQSSPCSPISSDLKTSFSPNSFKISPNSVKVSPARSNISSRTAQQRKLDDQLSMLDSIQKACEAIKTQENTEKLLQKDLSDFRKVKSRIEWTSHALDKIGSSQADMMIFQYNYMRNERNAQLTEKSLVSREFKQANRDPNRLIAMIERFKRKKQLHLTIL